MCYRKSLAFLAPKSRQFLGSSEAVFWTLIEGVPHGAAPELPKYFPPNPVSLEPIGQICQTNNFFYESQTNN